MPTYTLPNDLNQSGGLETGLIYLGGQEPSLMPAILLFVFMVLGGAIYLAQDRKSRGNFPIAFAISALITTTGAFILFLIPGLISLEVLSICVVVTSLIGLWAFLSNKD